MVCAVAAVDSARQRMDFMLFGESMISKRLLSIVLTVGWLAGALACSADDLRMGGSGSGSQAGVGAGAGGAFGNPEVNNPQPTAGASGMTAGAGGLAGTGNPTGVCEVIRATADPQVPDMLIVLDRSGSMTMGGRWTPSVSAIKTVTVALQSQIAFGLAMFPEPPADPSMVIGDALACLSAPDPQMCLDMIDAQACAPGGIIIPTAIDNADPIAQTLNMVMPAGGTPTPETLQTVLAEYANATVGPDQNVVLKYILFVTDGQPTCPNGAGMDVTQPDIDASNTAMEALTAAGVKTYVIGYDTNTPGNEMLAQVLDGFAQRGGTGAMMHTPVEDEASLLAALQGIASTLVSCSYMLDMAPQADHVLVKLDGAQINLNDPDGWVLVDDRTVQIQGAACAQLRSTGAHSVDVEVQCGIVPPS
jgi:hypothetical protein